MLQCSLGLYQCADAFRYPGYVYVNLTSRLMRPVMSFALFGLDVFLPRQCPLSRESMLGYLVPDSQVRVKDVRMAFRAFKAERAAEELQLGFGFQELHAGCRYGVLGWERSEAGF